MVFVYWFFIRNQKAGWFSPLLASDVVLSMFHFNLLDQIESMIKSFLCHELVMGSGFDDAALVEDDNSIRRAGCGKPVRHHDGLTTLLSGDRVGTALPVRVVRAGQVQDLEVVASERT